MALLKLKTEGTTIPVEIDGVEYRLAPFEGFSVTDQHQFKKDGKRIGALTKKDDPSDEEIAQLESITENWFSQVVGEIPEDVQKKLMPGLRQEIVGAYFLELGMVYQKQNKAASKSGRAKGSHPSQGSTRGRHSKSG